MKKILPTGEVNPLEHQNVPLWVVYGITKSHPQIRAVCVSRSSYDGSVNVWGYSTYKNSPAYRTDGTAVQEFIDSHASPKFEPSFFIDHDAALDYLKRLTTPRCDPIARR